MLLKYLYERNVQGVVLFALAIMTTIGIYWPGLDSYFVLDDHGPILGNDLLKIGDLSFASLITAALSSENDVGGRPLSMLSFALNHYFTGLDPFYFKLTNLGLHLIVAVVVFGFVYEVTKYSLAKKNGEKVEIKVCHIASLIALMVAVGWLVAPINTSSVLYVVQRMTILSSLFLLLSLYSYVKFRFSLIESKLGHLSLVWLLCVAFFFVLSFLSKEIAVLLIPHVLVLELFIFRGRNRWVGAPTLMKGLVAIVVLGIVLLIFLNNISLSYLTSGYEHRPFTLVERLLTESRVIFLYIEMIVFPQLQDFTIFHDDIEISKTYYWPITTLFSIVGLTGIFIAIWKLRNVQPLLTYAVAFFFVGHLLESTIFPLELMFEHRNYLPSVGILWAVVCGLLIVDEKSKGCYRWGVVGVGLLFLGVSAWVTYGVSHLWSNQLKHFEFTVKHHPNSMRAHNNLGSVYGSLSLVHEGDNKELLYQLAAKHQLISADLNGLSTEGLVHLIKLNSFHKKPIPDIWKDELMKRLTTSKRRLSVSSAVVDLPTCLDLPVGCLLSISEIEELITVAVTNPSLKGKDLADVKLGQVLFYSRYKKDFDTSLRILNEVIAEFGKKPKFVLYRARLYAAFGRNESAREDMEFIKQNSPLGNYENQLKELEIFMKSGGAVKT